MHAKNHTCIAWNSNQRAFHHGDYPSELFSNEQHLAGLDTNISGGYRRFLINLQAPSQILPDLHTSSKP